MIPKKIHYCWFGHNEKPELVLKCIESWKKYCPDYEIIEWNEDNIDVNFCSYSKRAYEQKRYGFATDVLRLKIIYEHGGIYLDTDVELINSLDDLLQYSAWFGYGTATEINTGSGFGADANNKFIKKLLESYLCLNDKEKFIVCTKHDTEVFKNNYPEFYANYHLQKNQILGDNIFISCELWKYSIHNYTGTWQTPTQKILNKLKITKLIKKIIN